MSKNGDRLQKVITKMGVSQEEALSMWNKGRSEPLELAKWTAYMAPPDSQQWKPCPDSVILHMDAVARGWNKLQHKI